MLCLIKCSKFQAVERLEMLQRWLAIFRNCSCEMGWKQDAFCGIINIYVDSFKLLKLSVVVIESKNEATAAFQNIVLCSLLLCRRVLEL